MCYRPRGRLIKAPIRLAAVSGHPLQSRVTGGFDVTEENEMATEVAIIIKETGQSESNKEMIKQAG